MDAEERQAREWKRQFLGQAAAERMKLTEESVLEFFRSIKGPVAEDDYRLLVEECIGRQGPFEKPEIYGRQGCPLFLIVHASAIAFGVFDPYRELDTMNLLVRMGLLVRIRPEAWHLGMLRVDIVHPLVCDLWQFTGVGNEADPELDVKAALAGWRYRDHEAARAEWQFKKLAGGREAGEG